MEKMRNVYKIVVGKPEIKSAFGRQRRRWKDVAINVIETGWKGVN
jgi:hypothetical protein